MKDIKDSIKKALGTIDDDLMKKITDALEENGCKSLEDCTLLEEKDLSSTTLTRIQLRKLMQVWKKPDEKDPSQKSAQPEAKPRRKKQAHIPAVLKAPLLTMSPMSADESKGDLPTIFVGIIQEKYTDEMWDEHVDSLRKLFGITDKAREFALKLASIGEQIDAAQLNRDIVKAIEFVNNTEVQQLRIVGLGIGSAPAVTEALESLIRMWNVPATNREVFFIALGESPNFHYLNFCKSLCLNELIKCIHYYNTMDYNNFGFFDSHNALALGLGGVMKRGKIPTECAQQ